MVDVTIDQLLTIGTNQAPDADSMIQQGGISFKARTRPNPPDQINVSSQAQLEAELGTNLEIADNQRVTIVLDAAFTLTKPFKRGVNAGLELYASTNNAPLTYTGAGALFQSINPGDLVDSLNLHNLHIIGDGTNSVFDVTGASVVEVKDVILSTFDSVGIIDNPQIIFDLVAFVDFTSQGLIMINPINVSITTCNVVQSAPTGMTVFTIQTSVVSNVNIEIVRALSFFAGDSLVFFDPNSPAGSNYTIEKSNVIAGDLYQIGTDIAINSVADNTSGNAEFTANSAHGLVVGKAVVISGFVTNTDYNGTFIVTAISGLTFDVDVAFGTDEAVGMMNAASLDNTDPIVFAESNNGTPDSSTISESSINGILEVDGSGGVAVPIVDVTPVAGDWVEDPSTQRFSVDTSTGIVTYNGINPVTVMIKYSLSADATSGASQDLDFDLRINGVQQTKSIVSIVSASPPAPALYNGGNFSINPGDTFQLFKNNTTNTNNTDISDATLLINLD